ncbi:folliculin-interacting protein 1 [Plakobranchus ocellatus]|uniref:Folliculin-interacting protein 1 n=1 Tax=Plakobranchus ocellatus TaxID=259542 RepID=A0AAV4A1N9_9GAST|nr:folliculin-interacting protein 1 [Plakobranchus ocellatus]
MKLELNTVVLKNRLNEIYKNAVSRKCTPPKLDKSKIRLVIFSESDRGRIPYFDSNAIKPLEEPAKHSTKLGKGSKSLKSSQDTQGIMPEQKPPPKYHFHRLGSDVKVLEEMMFGTAAMAFKGSTLKIHLLRSPPQLMISKVFIPEKPCRETSCDTESDSSSLPGSSADFSSGEFSLTFKKPSKERCARSVPVDVPSNDLSDYSTDDDSGLASFTSSGSMRTSSYPSPNNNSISSFSSLHRRWMRAQITSLDVQHRGKDRIIVTERSMHRSRRNKLAIALLFGSHDDNDEENHNQFQNFFFSHFALFEGHVEKMKSTIENAYFNNRSFLPSTMEALETFRTDIYDLYMTQRLPEPVWLSMMCATTYKTKLCEKFMETFTWLISKFDNKNCKFFVSTLLSAVLTQHLAWVATVTPAGGTPAHTYQDKHSAKWVDTLAKTHPYNPLWAQLGDLVGAIGQPRKISRTVVVGKKADIVKKLLYVLSYFIRCSEVHENTDPQCLNCIVNEPYLDVSLSPTSSEKTLLESTGSRWTPTLSGSGSGGVRASTGVDSQNLQPGHRQQHSSASTTNSDLLERNLSQFYAVDDLNSLNAPDSRLQSPKLNICTCQEGGADAKNPKIILSCDNCLSRENPFSSEKVQNHQGKKLPHQGSGEIFVGTTNVQKDSVFAMSELHNFVPHSVPGDILPPTLTSAIDSVSQTSYNEAEDFSASSDQVVRSQSFSGGKIRSRLAEQLETSSAESSVGVNKGKSAEIQKFLLEGTSQLSGQFEMASNMLKPQEGDRFADASISGSCLLADGKKEAEAKSLISRQSSHPGRPTSLNRHRSVTPTGLTRRRHLSSTGSIDYEAFDPMIHCKEVKMPFSVEECGQWHIRAFDKNFGRSLLAGYSDHYLSDFVLHGTSDVNYKPRLLNDLQTTVKHSILDEPIDEAVCVIADTDQWTVEVASSKVMGISPSGCTSWTSSKLVADLIESVMEISRLKMSAEFCLMHLEDRLQEIYFKSHMLSEYLTGATMYSQRELTSMLGFETSDMALLLAVAGTHSPGLSQLLST